MAQTTSTIAAALAFALCLAGCGDDEAPQAGPYGDYQSAMYQSLDNWLCHPAQSDDTNACAGDLTTSMVDVSGTVVIEPFSRPKIPRSIAFSRDGEFTSEFAFHLSRLFLG